MPENVDRPSPRVKAFRHASRSRINQPCYVLGKGTTGLGVTVDDISKTGLRLSVKAGVKMTVKPGEKLLLNTEIDGRPLRLEGIVVRSTEGPKQLIALTNLTWFHQ